MVRGSFFLYAASNYMVRGITSPPLISPKLQTATGDIIHTTCISWSWLELPACSSPRYVSEWSQDTQVFSGLQMGLWEWEACVCVCVHGTELSFCQLNICTVPTPPPWLSLFLLFLCLWEVLINVGWVWTWNRGPFFRVITLRGWKGERVAKVDAHMHRLTPLSHNSAWAKYPKGWETCAQILQFLAKGIQSLFKRLGLFVVPVIAQPYSQENMKLMLIYLKRVK